MADSLIVTRFITAVKRNFRIFSGLAALLLGIGLLVSAGQNLARRRLPPELAVKLVPIAKPEVVNLGHLGGHSPAGGRVFDMQGVAVIDSPLDSTLAAYGQLIGRDIVPDPSLPERSVNFRGQASAWSLSRQLAAVLLSNGVRMVQMEGGRVAAIGADRQLLWGNPEGELLSMLWLLLGLVSALVGLSLVFGSLRSPVSHPLSP